MAVARVVQTGSWLDDGEAVLVLLLEEECTSDDNLYYVAPASTAESLLLPAGVLDHATLKDALRLEFDQAISPRALVLVLALTLTPNPNRQATNKLIRPVGFRGKAEAWRLELSKMWRQAENAIPRCPSPYHSFVDSLSPALSRSLSDVGHLHGLRERGEAALQQPWCGRVVSLCGDQRLLKQTLRSEPATDPSP